MENFRVLPQFCVEARWARVALSWKDLHGSEEEKKNGARVNDTVVKRSAWLKPIIYYIVASQAQIDYRVNALEALSFAELL